MYFLFVQSNLICISALLVRGGYFFWSFMKKKNNEEDEIQSLLKQKSLEMFNVISQKKKSLKNAPAGRLRLSRNGNKMQWFHVTDKKETHGKYISVGNLKLAKDLAQKDYDVKILNLLCKQLNAVQRFLKVYSPHSVDAVFANMLSARCQLITPIRKLDNDYVNEWISEKHVGNPNYDESLEMVTARGDSVRSKSEVIIADTLYRLGIPYKYERPIVLSTRKGRIKVYPDFTCLNVRLRKEIIWEHFGKMDDGNYSANVALKMNDYFSNGYVMGDNLIFSMESEGNAFDAKKAEMLIKKFLL